MKHTKTDQLFIDDMFKRNGWKDWYIFDELRKVDCWQCKKKFETNLKLNRYCSPTCMNDALKPVKS